MSRPEEKGVSMATEEEGEEGAEKGPIEDKDLSLLMQELQSWKTEHEKFVLGSHFFHVSAASFSSAVCLSLSLSLSVCLCLSLSLCMSVCLSVSPSLSLSLPLSLSSP